MSKETRALAKIMYPINYKESGRRVGHCSICERDYVSEYECPYCGANLLFCEYHDEDDPCPCCDKLREMEREGTIEQAIEMFLGNNQAGVATTDINNVLRPALSIPNYDPEDYSSEKNQENPFDILYDDVKNSYLSGEKEKKDYGIQKQSISRVKQKPFLPGSVLQKEEIKSPEELGLQPIRPNIMSFSTKIEVIPPIEEAKDAIESHKKFIDRLKGGRRDRMRGN